MLVGLLAELLCGGEVDLALFQLLGDLLQSVDALLDIGITHRGYVDRTGVESAGSGYPNSNSTATATAATPSRTASTATTTRSLRAVRSLAAARALASTSR
jgi:hypothetical protein